MSALASDMSDTAKGLITNLTDAVRRKTEEPNYDALVAQIVDPNTAADMIDEDEDEESVDGPIRGKRKAKKAIVSGCCSACDKSGGSCGVAGEGVPGEYVDGSLFGMGDEDEDEDDVFAAEELSV
jgi:hypothetical protein